MYVKGGIRADHVSGGGSRMADSAEAATADARRTLLALACLLSAFFFNLVPPFLLKISVLLIKINLTQIQFLLEFANNIF